MKRSRFYYSRPAYTHKVTLIEMNSDTFHVIPAGTKLYPKPRLTVCGVLDEEANTLQFGFTVCSSKDRFEKKIGREISEKRALSNPIITVDVTKETTGETFMQIALDLEEQIMGTNYYLNY